MFSSDQKVKRIMFRPMCVRATIRTDCWAFFSRLGFLFVCVVCVFCCAAVMCVSSVAFTAYGLLFLLNAFGNLEGNNVDVN